MTDTQIQTVSAGAAEFVPGTDELLYERRGTTALLTFNRPAARNAMTWAMYQGLHDAAEHVDSDERVKVLVLRGAGDKAFVAGTDISQFTAFANTDDVLRYERMVSRTLEPAGSGAETCYRDDPRLLRRRWGSDRFSLRPADRDAGFALRDPGSPHAGQYRLDPWFRVDRRLDRGRPHQRAALHGPACRCRGGQADWPVQRDC